MPGNLSSFVEICCLGKAAQSLDFALFLSNTLEKIKQTFPIKNDATPWQDDGFFPGAAVNPAVYSITAH